MLHAMESRPIHDCYMASYSLNKTLCRSKHWLIVEESLIIVRSFSLNHFYINIMHF